VHDDVELVRRLRGGDEAAFALLVGRDQAQLLRLAASLVSSSRLPPGRRADDRLPRRRARGA
jgi:hypothetical protein